MEQKTEQTQSYFERKIKPILFYVGTIGAVITAIAYIAIVFIMVFGIVVEASPKQTIVFSIINAAIGLIMLQFLKIQGITFAKNLPQNIVIIKEYNSLKAKIKKVHSITYFWATSLVKDVAIKAVTICASTFGILYIVIQASNNYTLLLLALVNLLLFVCFGLLSLVKAYDFFNDEYVSFMQEAINKRKEEERKKANMLKEEEEKHAS